MNENHGHAPETVELPAPTAWPLVLSLGLALMGAGIATSIVFGIVGLVVFVYGLAGWIGQLLSPQGHVGEPLVEGKLRPATTMPAPGTVEALHPGMPGYRFRLPLKVHPISSGVLGGLVGGILMPIPALAYGLLVQGSPWLPINLLVGMVVPGLTDTSMEALKQFHPVGFIVGLLIHLAFSLTFGLMYGVILPMLPQIRGGPFLFGGILMPIFWTGVCYGLMGIVNPLLEEHVSWPWFILSQLVYGLAMSFVVYRSQKVAVAQHPRNPKNGQASQ